MNKSISRREFLQAGALAAAAAALAACRPDLPATATLTASGKPVTAAIPGTTAPATPTATSPAQADPLIAALQRLTFGPTPELIARARQLGLAAWLDQQLAPDPQDDPDLTHWLDRFTTFDMTPAERFALDQKALPAQEITAATVLRQRYSRWQVYEMLVDFWSNHFNIYIGKTICRVLKTDDDLQVIRPNALGPFASLLKASAHSPAMLVYLDQAESNKKIPNENYARELLELHTLSVDGGYTQFDVKAAARALTGWSIAGQRDPDFGAFRYRPGIHDDEAKDILDLHLPAGGGQSDGDRLLEHLAAHPATARFIALKLARRFVADDPPQSVVTDLAATFASQGGDLRALMRQLVASPEFTASAGGKTKRPLEFFVSALRAVDAQIIGRLQPLFNQLKLLGQPPFQWQTPDGYPDHADYWFTTSGLLNRWNFGLALVSGGISGVRVDARTLAGGAATADDAVDALAQRILGRRLPDDARAILVDFASAGALETQFAPLAGLIIGSPHFQMR